MDWHRFNIPKKKTKPKNTSNLQKSTHSLDMLETDMNICVESIPASFLVSGCAGACAGGFTGIIGTAVIAEVVGATETPGLVFLGCVSGLSFGYIGGVAGAAFYSTFKY